jgi:cyclohexadieny/prephenate dehydrogenase
MRRGGLARNIVGHAQSEKTRETALRLGLVTSVYAGAEEAVRGADLVVLCAPVGACGAIAKEIGPSLAQGAIVTDVGSVKGAIVRDVGPFMPAGVHFRLR